MQHFPPSIHPNVRPTIDLLPCVPVDVDDVRRPASRLLQIYILVSGSMDAERRQAVRIGHGIHQSLRRAPRTCSSLFNGTEAGCPGSLPRDMMRVRSASFPDPRSLSDASAIHIHRKKPSSMSQGSRLYSIMESKLVASETRKRGIVLRVKLPAYGKCHYSLETQRGRPTNLCYLDANSRRCRLDARLVTSWDFRRTHERYPTARVHHPIRSAHQLSVLMNYVERL